MMICNQMIGTGKTGRSTGNRSGVPDGAVTFLCCALSVDRLVGLVIKASASRAEDPGVESYQ